MSGQTRLAQAPAGAFVWPVIALLGLVVLVYIAVHRPGPAVVVSRPLPELNRTNLVRLQNFWCEAGHTNAFTGVLVEHYASGALMSRSVVANGLLNGLSEGWFTNGQIQVRESYRDNVSDGLRTKWYPNGHKLSEATIVNGQIEGVFRRWHSDGSLAEEIPMHDGHQEGVGRAFYPNGYLAEEVEMRDGKVIHQQSWQPDDRKKL